MPNSNPVTARQVADQFTDLYKADFNDKERALLRHCADVHRNGTPMRNHVCWILGVAILAVGATGLTWDDAWSLIVAEHFS